MPGTYADNQYDMAEGLRDYWDTIISSLGIDKDPATMKQIQSLFSQMNEERFMGGMFSNNNQALQDQIRSLMRRSSANWNKLSEQQKQVILQLGGALNTYRRGSQGGDPFDRGINDGRSQMAKNQMLLEKVIPLLGDRKGDTTSIEGLREALDAAIGGTGGNLNIAYTDTSSAGAAGDVVDPDAGKKDSILAELHVMYNELTGDPKNDPTYRGLTNAGMSAGQFAANAQGLRSNQGLGLRGVATAATKATMPYMQQRAGLAQNALSLANQRDLGLGNLELGREQLAANIMNMNNQANASMAAYAQQQNQGMGSLVGAGIGALGFLGGPALGTATMGAGASIGGAIGGMNSARPSLSTYTPKYTYQGGW